MIDCPETHIGEMRCAAEQIHAVYVDYFSAFVDNSGFLKDGMSMDGLHPNDKGYAVMAPPVHSAIETALKRE